MNPSSERDSALLDEVVAYLTKDGAVMDLARARQAAKLIRRLGAALSTQPQQGGWMPISEAAENMDRQVVVRWVDSEGYEHMQFDYTEDGCWMEWHNHAEHVEIIGGHGVSYTPPYTHFFPLPPVPGQEGGGV